MACFIQLSMSISIVNVSFIILSKGGKSEMLFQRGGTEAVPPRKGGNSKNLL